MLTLPHHFEFLTDRWLEEARRFVAAELAKRGKAPFSEAFGKPFSVAERFTHAPPHLQLEHNVAQWHLGVDAAGNVSVSRNFDTSADMVVEGDYQAAVTAGQVVGALSASVMDPALREIRHTFGADALRMRGQLAPPAARLLALLHDHMARRTVENPDLAHRAARLGMTARVRDMEDNGYTVIENAITPEFADEVRAATLHALRPYAEPSMQWMLYHGVEFERILQNPQLMTLIDASLGRGAVIGSISSICRGPGPGGIPLHTDYSMVPEPYPEFAMTGVGVWALEDWTEASGPTWLVPGSHRRRRGPTAAERANPQGGVPIEMPKGSVVYFTHGVWHWQGKRTEPGERVTLHSHFNRGILRSLEPRRVDPQMMHRNPPRLGEMLGEDDWFDKLDGHGRDQLRAAYMIRLHEFTDARKRELLAQPLAASA